MGGAVRQPATTATATIHSSPGRPRWASLLRIGKEPRQRRLQLLRIGLTRQRRSPHLACLAVIAACPDSLAPVSRDLGVVTDVVRALQCYESRLRIALPEAHPSQTI